MVWSTAQVSIIETHSKRCRPDSSALLGLQVPPKPEETESADADDSQLEAYVVRHAHLNARTSYDDVQE
jgi:hypothetical protein